MASRGDLIEIVKFLGKEARPELKCTAVKFVLGLTATSEGTKLIVDEPDVLKHLVETLRHEGDSDVAMDMYSVLINVSSEDDGARALLAAEEELSSQLLQYVMDPMSKAAGCACLLLINLTRHKDCCEKVLTAIETHYKLDTLVSVMCQSGHNKSGVSLDRLAVILANLSQLGRTRRYILDRNESLLQTLLPLMKFQESEVLRRGVVATVRNCCFETESHEWLLSEEVDILSSLLLPLAGPEEFPEEEMEKLPLDLQYLGEDKLRETVPEIRCMLLEALTQLCAKRAFREIMRERNVYLILRELHKWDKDSSVLTACENLVDILIRTEEEIGHDNLRDVEIPEDVAKKFDLLKVDDQQT